MKLIEELERNRERIPEKEENLGEEVGDGR